MNPNIEYKKFTQEIYQELVNADVLKTTDVQHNVKLKGRSGQEHQIDVYWEYEIAGTKQKVAIECKNYNKTVGIGKVRDFCGVLYDLNLIYIDFCFSHIFRFLYYIIIKLFVYCRL